MFRVILLIMVIVFVAAPLSAQDADTPAEPEGPGTFDILKGMVSPDVGWTFTVVVNTTPGSNNFLYGRSAVGIMELGPGFYEVHKLDIGDGVRIFTGDLELKFISNTCARRNRIAHDSHRDELILHCAAPLVWVLKTNAQMAAFTIIQLEDWSEA